MDLPSQESASKGVEVLNSVRDDGQRLLLQLHETWACLTQCPVLAVAAARHLGLCNRRAAETTGKRQPGTTLDQLSSEGNRE
jgi:hypothetical protein